MSNEPTNIELLRAEIGKASLQDWCTKHDIPYHRIHGILYRNVKRVDTKLGFAIQEATDGRVKMERW